MAMLKIKKQAVNKYHKKAGAFLAPAYARQFTNKLQTYKLLPHSHQDIRRKEQ